ncbi:uncharacterized protein LOC113239263 [Hyposmocoma kahamanoa]|uniref:uncharacterized protein LOC113239263 n=1 Tax=Hyposmocoma kahamanoa TaxID=1477025 RepID=UPI000E6D67BB|nr:uncharacterized protein LOC113239263 [Hyposmocoma kahamanoa]
MQPIVAMQYWADIKYKARKKSAAGGALGDLSSAEERLRGILDKGGSGGGGSGGGSGGVRRGSHSDEERKPSLALDDDACSEGSGAGAHDARLATEELLAEAAMRSALAAEKQAEAVAQGVELLRELVALVRERGLSAPVAPGPPVAVAHGHEQLHAPLHHHHRL